jgi:hypothetical protein
MPYDLAIRAGPVSSIDTPPSTGQRSGSASPSQPQTVAATPLANPSLVLDPSLGLVVIEFRNNAGDVVNSIPSARQLAAYRQNGVPSAARGEQALQGSMLRDR